MPLRVGTHGQWQVIQPTAEWKTIPLPSKKEEFDVATDHYCVDISRE